MTKILILLAVLFVLILPSTRCILFNLHNAAIYSVYDLFMYFYKKKWRDFNFYGIEMFIGMFGHGKTLSMTHYARTLYKRFGNNLLFVSNYKLFGIPYVPLVNFNQLLEIGEDKPKFYTPQELKDNVPPDFYYNENGRIKSEYIEHIPCRKFVCDNGVVDFIPLDSENKEDCIFMEKFPEDVVQRKMVVRFVPVGTVVLIDEIEDVLSHRNFSNFPLELLNVLTQQRKKHVYILTSAQRFFMVDKIFRGITTHVIDCNKFWRFQSMRFYDAWDYENAMNTQLIKPYGAKWWFVKNKDFAAYSTEQMISKTMSEDFISNDEKLSRIGLDTIVNEGAVNKPSKRLRKERKARTKAQR